MNERADVERLLYTTEQTAARLNIGITKTKELMRSGELRSIKVGRLRRITVSSIDEYVKIRELREIGEIR